MNWGSFFRGVSHPRYGSHKSCHSHVTSTLPVTLVCLAGTLETSELMAILIQGAGTMFGLELLRGTGHMPYPKHSTSPLCAGIIPPGCILVSWLPLQDPLNMVPAQAPSSFNLQLNLQAQGAGASGSIGLLLRNFISVAIVGIHGKRYWVFLIIAS